MNSEPRILPLEAPFDPEIEAMLAKWMPPNSGVEPLALVRTLGRHQDLASRSRPLAAGILDKGLVPPRLREVMIHRTCALTGAEYEWGVHVMGFGRPLGFTDEQIESTVNGSAEDPVWAPDEAAVFALAEALHRDSTIDDDLFDRLREHLEDEQILELCVTAGWYHAISYVINVASIPLEPWAARFDGPASTEGAG
ncbi:MAG: carboxymuconolactone decarboxylase family protein [Solirubrobacterales bacterium]